MLVFHSAHWQWHLAFLAFCFWEFVHEQAGGMVLFCLQPGGCSRSFGKAIRSCSLPIPQFWLNHPGGAEFSTGSLCSTPLPSQNSPSRVAISSVLADHSWTSQNISPAAWALHFSVGFWQKNGSGWSNAVTAWCQTPEQGNTNSCAYISPCAEWHFILASHAALHLDVFLCQDIIDIFCVE